MERTRTARIYRIGLGKTDEDKKVSQIVKAPELVMATSTTDVMVKAGQRFKDELNEDGVSLLFRTEDYEVVV